MNTVHFTYRVPEHGEDLCQGDVLTRTTDLEEVLGLYHAHYGLKKENTHFIVLTQSCDLVRRRGRIGARYLTIAPVRPLSHVLNREFEEGVDISVAGKRFASSRVQQKIEQLLNRLLNNNDEEFFFLAQEPAHGLSVDSCAVLRLGISIKVEHYERLLEARIIGLEDSFQSKLGYLIGRLYAKVGTRDLDEGVREAKVRDLMRSSIAWMDEKALHRFKTSIEDWQEKNPGKELTEDDLKKLMRAAKPDKKAEMIKRLEEIFDEGAGELPAPKKEALFLKIRNDSILSSLFR